MDKHGLKRSSGVDYNQVQDRQINDHRFERQRIIRAAAPSASPVEQQLKNVGLKASAPLSATMDAFMRMVTGKEERTIADRISDPNRPTWEQYKKENADNLDLGRNGEKEMKEYRKHLDSSRDKKLAGGSSSKKRKKRHKKHARSSSSDGSSTEDEHRHTTKHKSRKKRKTHKQRKKTLDANDSDSNFTEDRSRRHKHSKKSKKSSRTKDRDASPSPVRLSSFLQQSSNSSDEEAT